jgi:dTDP-glucose pyrophosphorylase
LGHRPDGGGEVQLTDAIQELIDRGHRVRAIKLRDDDIRLDIGTPETYWEALELSHRYALSRK